MFNNILFYKFIKIYKILTIINTMEYILSKIDNLNNNL